MSASPVHEARVGNDHAAALMAQGRYEEAASMLEAVVRLDPTLANAHSNLGTCYFAQRRLAEARDAYRAATAADPRFIYPRVQALTLSRELCEWEQWEREVAELRGLATSPQNTAPQVDLLFLPFDSEALRRHAECHAGPAAPWTAVPRRRRSPRPAIGYVSDEIRNHVVGTTLIEVLELHDRAAVDVHVFDWGRASGSIVERRARRAGIQHHDISQMNDRQAAGYIAALGIDVLVDLKGYTKGHRTDVFRHRPAPVQVNWLGYPGTLGSRALDYILTDPFVIPQGEESGYTESVLRLPTVLLPGDRQRPIASSGNREVFGLPEDAVVFCYLGRSSKITPEVFDDWMDILTGVPAAVLWMRADNDVARTNLTNAAKRRGLAEGRIVFYRESAHMRPSDLIARYRFADLALDTYPYGSHVTASDALWAGCPLLTRAGGTYASRVAGSLLKGLGLDALITTTREQFRQTGIELGLDPARLKALRSKLAEARDGSRVFDTPSFTRALERAYVEIIRRHDAQLPPAALDIAAD